MTVLANTSSPISIKKLALIISSSILVLSSCGDSTNYDFSSTPPPVAASPSSAFSPASGGPTTNNLLFNPVTGKLAIPDDPTNPNPVITALNELDGFSTTAPITTTFGTPLDPTSLVIGSSIRVFEVTKAPSGAVTGVIGELGQADITAAATGTNNTTLALVPLKPLKQNSTYMVILTTGANGIKDAHGDPATSSGTYLLLRGDSDLSLIQPTPFPATATQTAAEALAQAQQLQALVGTMEGAAVGAGVSKESIIMSWSFTTQSISTVLDSLASTTGAGAIVAAPVQNPPVTGPVQTTKDINPALAGVADVYIGILDIPYYLAVPTMQNPTAPLTAFWSEPLGTPTTLTIPLIMTVPNTNSGKTMPMAGWPMVMYQHGITRARTDMLVHADSLAAKGFASIAIDLPLHGITDKTNPFHADNTPAAFFDETEFTFDLDLANNTSGAAGPDTNIDDSGTHFINLTSLLTSRDNIRQGVVNLLVLRKSLGNIPGVTIDTTNVGFLAHSLGGIVGTTYLALENQSTPTSLVTTGGGIAQLLNGSTSFGPRIRAGLAAAQGATLSNADLQSFLVGAQAVLDAADPINYAATAASKHPIHMIEVVGDGTDNNLPDQTIPNTVPQRGTPDPELVPASPLSGTEPLARIMGLRSVGSSEMALTDDIIIRFTQGEHGTLLTPTKTGGAANNVDLLNVFTEMQLQISRFMETAGNEILITDNSFITPSTTAVAKLSNSE